MPGHAPYPDRHNARTAQRERLCRQCGRWRRIAAFDRYRNPGQEWRRRRLCRYCRNAEQCRWRDRQAERVG